MKKMRLPWPFAFCVTVLAGGLPVASGWFAAAPAIAIAQPRLSFCTGGARLLPKSHRGSSGVNLRRATLMEGEKKGREAWPVRRFLKQVVFFNRPRLTVPPPLRQLVLRRGGGGGTAVATAPVADRKCPDALSGGAILVTGATGGVGRRVVERLLQRGATVRALARNRSKAAAMLSGLSQGGGGGGGRLEVVTADIRDPSSLIPAVFDGVVAAVSCTAAIVQPKEGDGPDRAKYYQGIKFFEPEVADAPEETEAKGLKNLLAALAAHSDIAGKTLFGCEPGGQRERWRRWGALDDVVMGGVSDSGVAVVAVAGGGAAAVFEGTVSTSNSGGFASIRCRNSNPAWDLSAYDGLRLRVRGDGKRYKFIVYDRSGWDSMSWCRTFDTPKDEWTDVTIPWADFVPNFRNAAMPNAPPLSTSSIFSFQLMLSKFEYNGELNPNFAAGTFRLEIDYIRAFKGLQQGEKGGGVLPRLVHVSSAGVTRPGRPGLIVEQEPPAVRMNDMLGGLLTHKLAGEDAVRSSGIPAVIVRPCALTEEPGGAKLLVEQGDNIKGKISRDDIADLCVEALLTPLPQIAAGAGDETPSSVTLEVKSDLAFSDVWQGGADGRACERPDYATLLGGLDPAVTGKEWMQEK